MYTFVPILRPDEITWETIGGISEQGGLLEFTGDKLQEDLAIPLLEITEPDHISEVQRYRERFDQVLVDCPVYVDNPLLEDSAETSVSFHLTHTDAVPIPVLSTDYDGRTLTDYEPLVEAYKKLSNHFETIAVRPFIPATEFVQKQLDELDQLEELLRPSDIVLPDVWNVENGLGQVYKNLQGICYTFEDYETYLLNVFNPRNDSQEAHNYGPLFTSELDVAGFGDRLLSMRDPPSGPVGTSTRHIRHYAPKSFKRIRFRGEDGYRDAYQKLSGSEYWKPGEYDYLRLAEQSQNWGGKFWRRIRIGYYIECIQEHLEEMEQYQGEELDMDGYNALRKQLGDDDEK